MNIRNILQRSWQLLWQYRAMWVLGMILALTASNTIFLGSRQNAQNPQPNNFKVKLTDTFTLNLPGDGIIIDLTQPGGNRLIITNGLTEGDKRYLETLVGQTYRSDFIAVGIEILVILMLIGLINTFARYVAETAVIRMVNDTETNGVQLSLRQGLRLGWSARAARLFLIDLLVALVIASILALILPMSVGSIMLVSSLGFWPILFAAFGVLGLLMLTTLLLVGVGAFTSLIMQTVRRACVIDDKGVIASFTEGFHLFRHHMKDIGLTWLIWIGIRILWAPVGILAAIIVAPVMFVCMLAGGALGLIPAALAAGIASPFVNGITPWVIGFIAWLPILILAAILPLLFVSSWVEIYKANLWTLAYRELSAMEHIVPTVQPKKPLTPATGTAR